MKIILFIILTLSAFYVNAQNLTQTIRGQVRDQESEMPLAGATVTIAQEEVIGGSISDTDGDFKITDVPVGRVNLQVKMQGYELLVMSGLVVTSGKELVLNLDMQESIASEDVNLEDVVITDEQEGRKPLNEMATLSAKSFSVEETKRYPAAIMDPGRMAQNFAGVTSSGNDMSNEIVIRGNSPRGMLWRLEGIEIPNPNHFGDMGSSGGPISMLSSSTLGNSDFYTGAFPSEFGSSYSGVFDLRFRRGNSQQRESSIMFGVLGLEASTEGYFSKSSKASYLVNYRYSTLALMQTFVPSLDVLPKYQDLSFNIHLPTKVGDFGVFGLGGTNVAEGDIPTADSSQWDSSDDGTNFWSRQHVGVLGLKHRLLIGEKSYLKTVAAVSIDNYKDYSYRLLPEQNYAEDAYDETKFENYALRFHTQFNSKIDARNSFRAGLIGSQLDYSYFYRNKDWDENLWTIYFDQGGNTQQLEGYAQWKHRLNEEVTINGGVHGTYLALNKKYAIDPRAAISWKPSDNHKLSFAMGLHSKPEHLSVYLAEESNPGEPRTLPNMNLDLLRSVHLVAGHDWSLAKDWNLKTEIYFQHLYNVAVSSDSGSNFAIINTAGVWALDDASNLTSTGTGRNYGIDLTLNKFFSNQYYLMLTGSLYNSEYSPREGEWYSTRYNGNYNLSILGGKELKVGKNKKNTLGLNGKAVLSGGNRFTPINFAASKEAGYTVRYLDRPYEDQVADYWRLDLGIHYTINAKASTHSLMIDIQNVTNRANLWGQWYNSETAQMETDYQNGIFPLLNYRFEF